MYLLSVIFFFNDVAISESENLEFAPTQKVLISRPELERYPGHDTPMCESDKL